ncbi:MAG: hypothetical protein K1X53_00955 [Candidatus Sumerlaeaceae bacterium]|nr:hypothetical protein [Candidatus Sumerlaeaceae bacterium]
MALGLLMCCLQAAATPGFLNYQAKLTDNNGVPINAIVTMTFTLWDSPSGGNQLGGGFVDFDSASIVSGVCSETVGDPPGNSIPPTVFASDSVWLNVNVDGNDIVPRSRVVADGYALGALPLVGPAHVIVNVTNQAGTNGTNLLAAYATAKSLTPHGLARSANNRVTVLVPPGNYDLGVNQLTLDTEFVDLVGLSKARDGQYIQGTANGVGTGVVAQTANNVRMENLTVHCSLSTGGGFFDPSGQAAYFPASGTTNTVVRNCRFSANESNAWSMRAAVNYPGTFENCVASGAGFGGNGGVASGKFTNCTGGSFSFGGNSGGLASGTFDSCAGGLGAFGGLGTASGTFSNCTGSFLAFGGGGTASGTFTNCTGDDYSFAGRAIGTVIASGVFTNCVGGFESFGGGGAVNTAARLHGCRLKAFSTWTGTFNGLMENCRWGFGITLGANARVYGCTFPGTVDLNNTAAGVTGTRAQNITNEASNVFGATSTIALNIEDGDVN